MRVVSRLDGVTHVTDQLVDTGRSISPLFVTRRIVQLSVGTGDHARNFAFADDLQYSSAASICNEDPGSSRLHRVSPWKKSYEADHALQPHGLTCIKHHHFSLVPSSSVPFIGQGFSDDQARNTCRSTGTSKRGNNELRNDCSHSTCSRRRSAAMRIKAQHLAINGFAVQHVAELLDQFIIRARGFYVLSL